MANFEAIAYQFLSIKEPLGCVVRCPASQAGTKITFEFSVIGKPFDISFASITGRNPDIGAIQYVDSSDHYADMRWPTCVQAGIKIETDRDMTAADAVSDLLLDIRDALSAVLAQNPLFDTTGHLSRHAGYRRSYGAPPNLDIARNRRPRPSEHYHPTAIGEYLGPGVITLNDPTPMDYVWSQIIPFPNVTDIATDRTRLLEIIESMRLHYNSYNELRDARDHLIRANKTGLLADLKAAVRTGASAVDPLIRFYCKLHSIAFPGGSLSFDQKIERVLAASGMPSYATVNAAGLALIGKLYRARNSMHEGDIYFKGTDGKPVKVDLSMAEDFLAAAEQFVLWIDSLA
jgi:hypothetical protein